MQFARAFLAGHKPQVPIPVPIPRVGRTERTCEACAPPRAHARHARVGRGADGLVQRLRRGHRLHRRLLSRDRAEPHGVRGAHASAARPAARCKPKRVLELGFGQGFGLTLLAAANPDVAFEGYDFNPEHVAHARRLIEGAGLANITVTETGFEEAAARGGDNDLDAIALHGIFSWVARAGAGRDRSDRAPAPAARRPRSTSPTTACRAGRRSRRSASSWCEVKRRNPGRSERQLALALDLISQAASRAERRLFRRQSRPPRSISTRCSRWIASISRTSISTSTGTCSSSPTWWRA